MRYGKYPMMYVVLAVLGLVMGGMRLSAQEVHLKPRWWFGGAAGANINFYNGSISQPNPSTTTVTPGFSRGSGLGLFLAPLLEYRPGNVWGGMLQFGFDSRRGSFDEVNPPGKTFGITTAMNYLSLEPSVRMSPSGGRFHFFAGPRIGFNISKSFKLTETGAPAVGGDWSGSRGTVLSAQVGAGYDIPLSDPDARWQTELAPFVSAHFGQGPRSEESWSLFSLRVGAGIKFGSTTSLKEEVEREVTFSVRAPKLIPSERQVKETFPMRNYIFFDEGSAAIPERYVRLTSEQARDFSEAGLMKPEPKDLTGRSRRQTSVYHHVVNVLGDRLRAKPDASVTLVGSSLDGDAEGRELAESVKQYLIDIFGIEPSRVVTQGRTKPEVPSFRPGGTREVDLVRAEDRRVEIIDPSGELLVPVQIISLQEDPLDTDVLLNTAGASNLLASWSLEVTDQNGGIKKYGPFTGDQERVSGKDMLADKMEGTYTVVMIGETKGGQTIRKSETIRLARSDQPDDNIGLRFSILFEFDQSKTVSTYEQFLTKTVAPLIPAGSSVIIHGHTDIVGEERHNLELSKGRSHETMQILQRTLAAAGKRNVKFDTYGFGEDIRRAPFGNQLPEERFYNRTVIIDIVPE